jgi:hypothetical protein
MMRDHILAAVLHRAGLPGGINPNPATPPFGADLNTILQWIAWVATAACVVGILIVAATMAIRHQRGEGGQHVSGLGWVLAGCILIGTATALVGTFT